MALRLSDSWRKRKARPKHESAWYSKFKKLVFKKIQNHFQQEKLGLKRSNGIGLKERHQLKTLLAALWRISNWFVRHINLLLFLLTHSTSVLFFVLVVSPQVCDSAASSTTFSENFTMAYFVVKPALRSNKPSKFKSSVRYLCAIG